MSPHASDENIFGQLEVFVGLGEVDELHEIVVEDALKPGLLKEIADAFLEAVGVERRKSNFLRFPAVDVETKKLVVEKRTPGFEPLNGVRETSVGPLRRTRHAEARNIL